MSQAEAAIGRSSSSDSGPIPRPRKPRGRVSTRAFRRHAPARDDRDGTRLQPKILIADEPTTALDVTTQAGILDLMRDIRERLGTAIVLVTHNLGVVADVADRVLVMYAGRRPRRPRCTSCSPPQHPYTVGLLAAIPRVDASGGARARLREIPGRLPSRREPPAGCAFAERCPRVDERACRSRPELRPVGRDHWVACVPPGPDDPERAVPALEVDRPRQALPGLARASRAAALSCTPWTVCRSRSAGVRCSASWASREPGSHARRGASCGSSSRRQGRSACGTRYHAPLARSMRPLRRELHIVFRIPVVAEPANDLRSSRRRAPAPASPRARARARRARRRDLDDGRVTARVRYRFRTSSREVSASGSALRAR